jgi:hypothetical protein
MSVKQKMCRLLSVLVLVAIAILCQAVAAESNDGDMGEAVQSPPKLTAVRYVTWWSHDAVGYHPAIFLRLENTSGQSLLGERLRMQARFTNIRTAEPTVARFDQRISLAKNQQKDIMLRGPTPFELSIDDNAWPTIECKVMCRIGDVDDSGTLTLAIANLEHITMTDEEAQTQLEKQPDLRRPLASGQAFSRNQSRAPTLQKSGEIEQIAKPLVATAAGLNAAVVKIPGDAKRVIGKFATPTALPSLGDNFYLFEQKFGLPLAIESPQSQTGPALGQLTWASYKARSPFSDILVASRNGASADAIMVTLPSRVDWREEQLMSLAKTLAGRGKAAELGPFAHSVRYFANGRREFAEAASPSCKALTFKLGESEKTVLFVSRLGGDPETFVEANARRLQSQN